MSRFTDELIVSPLPDGRTWVIRRDFGYDIGKEGSVNTINVPIGFKTDFASVPRFMWAFIPRWGKYGNAAVIHDFLYWEQKYTRNESDRIFLEAMCVLEVSYLIRTLIFYAVRLFGWYAWNKNKKMKLINLKYKIHEPMTNIVLQLKAKPSTKT
ncbi:MAG: DUF1353 domain-containing protein [Candidatus Mariimomonas ferrooxydans]